jgi:hypothetical protein
LPEASRWLLLIYRIPAEPSRHRVAVWRRLKEAGAVYLQNSTCILPESAANHHLFETLAGDIHEAGGESLLLSAEFLDRSGHNRVVDRFNAERDVEYAEFLEQGVAFLDELRKETGRRNLTFGELEENNEGFDRLERWLRKIKDRDFFGAAKAAEAEKCLAACREALEAFTVLVFQASHGPGDPYRRGTE